jgi:predicted DCC family thiol-disulfide oxidoreductase YuxK
MPAPADKTELLYDDDCPVCRAYCTRVEMREDAGALELVDARKPGALLAEVTAMGLDIDEGMVVKRGGKIYYGSDAMRVLTGLKKSGWMERSLFGGRLAGPVYALGKAVRNIVLRVLRIPKIGNLR